MITLEDLIQSVTIQRIEGPEYICVQQYTYDTIEDADTKLIEWSIGSDKDSYFKVRYTIDFLDGRQYDNVYHVLGYDPITRMSLRKWFHKQYTI
jgi:putative lipoic acid-binding regulatory protein